MDRGIEQPLPPTLRALPIAGIFLDVGNQPRVEDRFAIMPGIEPAIEIEIGTADFSDLSVWLRASRRSIRPEGAQYPLHSPAPPAAGPAQSRCSRRSQ